jgi:phage terminase large subunit GpA-like protein
VATVDTQGDGFVCQTTGFASNGDAVIIDGWKIKSSNRLDADGKNQPVDPRAFSEDWDMLVDQVLDKTYELGDGSGRRMRIKMASVDGYGQEGVTTQAYRFWQRLKARGDGSHRRFAIGKGEPRKDWPIAKSVMTEVGEGKKHALVRGAIPRIHFGSTLVKDTVANLMSRRIAADDQDTGGGKLRYPNWMPKWFYSQLTNEIRTPKGWEKIGSRRNEVFDLTAYAIGLVYRPLESNEFPWPNIQLHRINWNKPPAWAAPWDENELVFDTVAGGEAVPALTVQKSSFADLAGKLA